MEDWQVIVNLATALGVTFDYTAALISAPTSSRACRAVDALQGLAELAFTASDVGQDVARNV